MPVLPVPAKEEALATRVVVVKGTGGERQSRQLLTAILISQSEAPSSAFRVAGNLQTRTHACFVCRGWALGVCASWPSRTLNAQVGPTHFAGDDSATVRTTRRSEPYSSNRNGAGGRRGGVCRPENQAQEGQVTAGSPLRASCSPHPGSAAPLGPVQRPSQLPL